MPINEYIFTCNFFTHCVHYSCQSGLDVSSDGVLSELGGKVVADVAHVFEDEDDRVYCIVGWAVVVIGVGEVLEQGEEVSDAFNFKSYLGVVKMLITLLRKGFGLIGGLELFCLLHLA